MNTFGKQITKEAQLLASLHKICIFCLSLLWPQRKTNTKLWEKQTGQKGKFWLVSSLSFWTVMLEKILESPLDCKEIQPVHPKGSVLNVHWKDWCWSWNSNTLATWCEELTHWKRPWCWERLRAGGEGDNRGWDGWMASPTRWTWVWVNSGRWWWTGRSSVLWSMGWQRFGHVWVTELKYIDVWNKIKHLPHLALFTYFLHHRCEIYLFRNQMPIEADLVLSSFDSVPCRFCIVYKLKVCGHPMSSNSIGSHYFYSNICSHHVSESHFGNSYSISNFKIIVIRAVEVCNWWSLMLLSSLTEGSDDG